MKKNTESISYLRLFHALPTPNSYDIYLDEKKIKKDFLYEDFTPYYPLSSGTHTFTLCAYKHHDSLYTRQLTLNPHKIYTLVLAYEPSTLNIQSYLLVDIPKPIPEEHFLMRCGNFSLLTKPLTLHLADTKPIFKKVPLRQNSVYLAFTPTIATLELVSQENQTIVFTQTTQPLKVSRYYSLYLIGGHLNYPLKWITTLDGNAYLTFDS